MRRIHYRKKTPNFIKIIFFSLFLLGGAGVFLYMLLGQNPPISAQPLSPSSSSHSATPAVTSQESSAKIPAQTALEEKTTALLADWRLTLVNNSNPLPTSWQTSLVDINANNQVDQRIFTSLTALLDACTQAGFDPMVCSAYRTKEDQVSLYENQIARYENEGESPEKSAELAATAVARPDTSEHQLGFAVDIVSLNNQRLDTSQEENPAQIWLMENSWRYGFILRYPKDKTALTMKMYEPWHYRYVGEAYAPYIFENKLCLEEFLSNPPVEALELP